MPIFGFDKAYFLEDMPGLKGSGLMPGHPQKVKFEDLDSDRLLFETNLDKIVPEGDDPFFSFVTTITMHGNYDDLVNLGDYPYKGDPNAERKKEEFSKKANVKGMEEYYEKIDREYFDANFSFLRDNGYPKEQTDELYLRYKRYKRYQASYMDLDKGLEALVKHLDEVGKLSNTTIVVYADHSAYFHGMNYSLKNVPLGEYYNPAVYNIPFFIYSGKMPLDIDGVIHHNPLNPPFESLTVERFSSTLDIVPTILDLLGYKVNAGLYHGNSVFLEEGGIFASMSAGYFDDLYYSGDGETLLYPNSFTKAEEEAFQKKTVEYLKRQEKYEYMYKYDYFKHAGDYGFLDINNLVTKFV